MQSDLPKVMHPALGRPMVEWVVDAARTVGCTPVVLVVGHGAEAVRVRHRDFTFLTVNGVDATTPAMQRQLATAQVLAHAVPDLLVSPQGDYLRIDVDRRHIVDDRRPLPPLRLTEQMPQQRRLPRPEEAAQHRHWR